MRADYVPDYRHCLLPYVQWFQDDFLGGIRGMKAQEIGIYTVLLNEMYNRGVALDQPDERLARWCGADIRVFKKVLNDLIDEEKIVRLDCGLWNLRCEITFTSRAKMLEKQSAAGKESGKKRRKNKGGLEHPLNDSSSGVEPISEAQNKIISEPKGSSSEMASDRPEKSASQKQHIAEFNETFWPIYPRKVQKKNALSAYLKARKKTPLETIMAGIRRFVADITGKDPQFIPHPAKWLNGESWADGTEVVEVAPKIPDEETWTKRLSYARQKLRWNIASWGAMPGSPGCVVPENLLHPEDGAGWREWEQAA